MIRDLSGQGALAEEVDVLVIGAGTAGMVAASLLARQGLVVHCLESGSAEQREDTHPLNECEQVGTYYAGADHGRFRCLGGTSTRWGGAMIPFQAQDMAPDLWPIGAEELSPYADRVEELFHLPPGDYTDPALMDGPEFIARLAKWPPFRRRNTYNLFRHDADSPTGPTIWLNATVTRLTLSQGRVSEVAAQAPDGSSIRIRAKDVILAAGSIESTRLLLLADRANGGAISASSTGLGSYFHDHLSAVVGEIEAFDRIKLNQRVGFSFAQGGAMRNVRFELEPASSLRQSVPPCFAHIGFDDETGGGFDALRDVFRQLQRRRLPGIKTMLRLVAGAPWLIRAVWWRMARKRLLYPAETSLKLHMVIEQAAVPGNRISLSDGRTDVYGQPLARIDWNVSTEDIAAMQRATDAFLQCWEGSAFAKLGRIHRHGDQAVATAIRDGGGIYHPGGSTRMGHSSAQGVVDRDLRLFAADNLRVLSTSVFPSGGGANPTMLLLMLALRCVDQIAADQRPASEAVRS